MIISRCLLAPCCARFRRADERPAALGEADVPSERHSPRNGVPEQGWPTTGDWREKIELWIAGRKMVSVADAHRPRSGRDTSGARVAC